MPKNKSRGNGQGTVYKRGDTWTAEVVLGYRPDKNGKRRPVRVTKGGFKRKTDALNALPVLKTKGRKPKAEQQVTFESLWLSFSETALLKLSKDKQSHYRTARKKIEDIAYIDIRLLTIDDLQDLVEEQAPTYYPAKDIKTLLKHLYTRAQAHEVVRANLAEFIILPELNEKPTRPFTCDEVFVLWKGWHGGDRMCGYALLMIYTGMMPGELGRLTADMISWEEQIITDCGLKTDYRKEHPIILPDIILPVLRTLCEISLKGKISPYRKDAFCIEFKAMINRYGLDEALKPYSCRHTTATTLALADTPLLKMKEVMRHSKVTTTQKYVHIKTAPLVQAVNEAYGTT